MALRRLSTFVTPAMVLAAALLAAALPVREAGPAAEASPATAPPARSGPVVFAHYYPWYSAPPRTADYIHWDAAGHEPPGDLAAPSYPVLGPYDSRSPSVLNQHMAWMRLAKIDVLIVSWWGSGSLEDKAVPAVLDAAAAAGLKVAFMIEPYPGRTPAGTVRDIAYLYAQYGRHPAFYRVSRPTMYGPNAAARGVFFVYGVDAAQPWARALDTFRGRSNDGIVLMRMNDDMMLTDAGARTALSWTHADGLFNYGTYDNTSAYNRTLPRPTDYLLVYSASPGFDNTRIGGSQRVDRQEGAFYDASWAPLAQQKPEWVSIVSFNEWHEGTQIEPAFWGFSAGGYTYQDYEGHYGKTGIDAAASYLVRTAYWVEAYKTP